MFEFFYLAPDGRYYGPAPGLKMEDWLRTGRLSHATWIAPHAHGPFFPASVFWDVTTASFRKAVNFNAWYYREESSDAWYYREETSGPSGQDRNVKNSRIVLPGYHHHYSGVSREEVLEEIAQQGSIASRRGDQEALKQVELGSEFQVIILINLNTAPSSEFF